MPHSTGRPEEPAPNPKLPSSLPTTGEFRSGVETSAESTLHAASLPGTATVPHRGRFTILKKHAQGGLGLVSLAHDERLNRPVALKEIRADKRGSQILQRRFLTEAEITSQLQHPGIVPIYGLEEDEAGEPYYTMRFVEGKTLAQAILEFHRRKRESPKLASFDSLMFRELLQRFINVCQTVAYAHSKGVIHRDLKPANIMLGDFGETLVLDWGLAKRFLSADSSVLSEESEVLNSGLSTPDPGLTAAGQILGTPAYMSPEQAEGREELGSATDIYALGAILYEILTARPPYEGRNADEILTRVRAGPPPSPLEAERCAPAALASVCRKALERQPQCRYVTASDLAQDVGRWLADEPVAAHAEPWRQRVARWARRHRTLVTSAAAMLLAASIVLVGATLRLQAKNVQLTDSYQREHSAKKRAEASYHSARKALKKALALQDDPRFQQGPLEDVKRLLLEAEASFYAEFVEFRSDEESFLSEQADAHSRLTRITSHLGSPEDAIRHGREALAQYAILQANHPDSREYQFRVADAHGRLGLLYHNSGRTEEAEAAHKQALRMAEALAGPNPTDPDDQEAVAQYAKDLGAFYAETSRLKEATEFVQRSVEIRKRLVSSLPDERRFWVGLADTYNVLAAVHERGGQKSEAERAFREALEIRLSLSRGRPSDRDSQKDLFSAYNNLGTFYLITDRFMLAEEAFRQALQVIEPMAAAHPLVTSYQSALVHALGDLARVVSQFGRFDESEKYYQRAVPIQEQLLRENPSHILHPSALANLYMGLGRNAHLANKPQEAQERYRRSVDLLEGLLARSPSNSNAREQLCKVLPARAITLAQAGRPAEAVKDFHRLLELTGGAKLDLGSVVYTLALGSARKQLSEHVSQGAHAAAVADANTLADHKHAPADCHYAMAGVFAVAAGSMKDDRLRSQYATRAIELLERARMAGFFKDVPRIESLHNDRDFESIRSRPEFLKLCQQLETTSKPGP
jgi:serine/threonine-protein kinase